MEKKWDGLIGNNSVLCGTCTCKHRLFTASLFSTQKKKRERVGEQSEREMRSTGESGWEVSEASKRKIERLWTSLDKSELIRLLPLLSPGS